MSYNVSDLINELIVLIPEVETELKKRLDGVQGDGSSKQLELICDELKQILKYAKSDGIPPKGMRYTAFSRFIVDEWDLDSTLGKKLCTLADRYKRI